MLFNSVIILVREVLEAAIMISVLLTISRSLGIGTRWFAYGAVAGLFGSIAYGVNMFAVSELFDGVGQEVVDAVLQFTVFTVLVGSVFLILRRDRGATGTVAILPAAMACATALAATREGAEILVYVAGYWQLRDAAVGVGAGSLLGAIVAVSVAVLFYYLLLSLPRRIAIPVGVTLLALIGAGMSAQATGLLIQADWLSAGGQLWDTSEIVPEESLLGQLLYALVGYESTPTAAEVAIYAGSLVVMAVASAVATATAIAGAATRLQDSPS